MTGFHPQHTENQQFDEFVTRPIQNPLVIRLDAGVVVPPVSKTVNNNKNVMFSGQLDSTSRTY